MIKFIKTYKDSILFFVLISAIVGAFAYGIWYIDNHRPPLCKICTWTLVHANGSEVEIYGCCDEPPELVETTSYYNKQPRWRYDGSISQYSDIYTLK